MAETPKHYIRCPHDVWNKAATRAQREGTTLSRRVREFLEAYAGDSPVEDEVHRIISQMIAVHRRLEGKVETNGAKR